ncbi:LysR family transcriptional regulator [Azospirillum picis]|uniref:DNA-binding transcriptional LysR family regulator n=1 Tax=Azospirillum picis TaxID=488438 RepID=A0ABU0MKF6_9PROT|nr:LysR family transcriptional regulator [Azospirillum picis]MBP2300208.1 DNA-binding transcriptional LysR family regulator [Azospirillum picis]MDQ0533950.1 DNA-binding transcriptional LysR family regulator [Azospirillum picis]
MTVQKFTGAGPLDWDDLRVFLELARAGSLSAAARRLRLSHATVGRRLAALEESLGRTLMERRPDGYVLTEEGEGVRALAEAMDERAQAIRRREGGQAGAEAGLGGTVRLTMTQALADRFVIPRLGALRRAHPGLDLEVIADNRTLSLARREADLAIRLARPQRGDLVGRRLATLAYGLYAAPDASDALVAYDETMAELPEALWLARHCAGRRVAFRSNSVQGQLAAAVAGFGAALLPCLLADGVLGLERCPQPGPPLNREAWLLVHRDRCEVPRVRAVIEHLVAIFTDERPRLEGDRP